MVAIVNIDENPRPKGMHLYSIRINHKEVGRCYHMREHSLATLLETAAFHIRNPQEQPVDTKE